MFKVIHNGNLHWQAISTIGCKKGEVILLDSLFHHRITIQTQRQICCLLNSSLGSIIVKSIPVQQQTGGVDCGLFAIAFLEFVARTYSNPVDVSFDQKQFRNHALRCLKDDRIYPFPVANSFYKKRSATKEFELKLYCECRMIWTPSDGRVNGK